MNEVIAGGLVLAFALWHLWPQVRSVLSKIGGVIPNVMPVSNPNAETVKQDDEDFRSYRKLVYRAKRVGNPEAAKYLLAAMPLLFGAPNPSDDF